MAGKKGAGAKSDEYFMRRFWKYVNQIGSCWLWERSLNFKGYGNFSARLEGQKFWKAHRYSWALHNGPIPDGMDVLHTCDNPWCVNPDHMYLGDDIQNVKDRDRRGRVQRGERHYMSKLNEDQVRVIKHTDTPTRELAEQFGVHYTTVLKVRLGERWKHVN